MKSVTRSVTVRALGKRARIARVMVAVAFAGLFTAACDDSSGPRTIASVVVSPTTAIIPVGGTQQFTVVITDSEGNVLVNRNPVWSIVSGGGTITQAGLFTAATVPGTTVISVTCSGVTATATITVNAGPGASIVVAPDTTLLVGATAQFRAVIRDAFNNVLTIAPVWSTANPPGTIVATTGLFTAGNTVGSYPNSVSGCIPTTTICDQANVIVIAPAPPPPPPPPPPPASGGFTVLGRAAVTCTTGSIIGDVGTFQAAGDAPPGTITASCIPVTTGTVHAPGDPATKTAYNNFLAAYTARAPLPGDCDATHTLTGTLAGVTLPPGVYCFTAGASLTGTLTLNGTATDLWLFKIGTAGTGDLTGTNFTVIMAGTAQACNVTWWVRQATAMTTSNFKGTVLGGTGVTATGGTFNGNMWAGASGIGDATESNAAVTGCP
jgi:hypothetical protein